MRELAAIASPGGGFRVAANLAFAGLLLGAATHAGAQARPPAWQFELTPYLWGAAMKGDVQTANLPRTSVDESFSDILDVLDFGLMAAFEARKGRWGLLTDLIYLKISEDGSATGTGPGPLGATITASAELEMKQTVLSAAVAYRAVDASTPVDVLGGLRYLAMDADARIEATIIGQTGVLTRSGDKDWLDPYVGVRVQHPIASRWTLVGYADIGGFGVGSDFTYQLAAGLDYRFSDKVTGKFGYRYMNIDYDKDEFVYDIRYEGVYLGVGIRF